MLWELGPGLWPLNIGTPVFAIIIAGAATVGGFLVAAGVRGEGQRWSFPPRAVVIHRSGWRSERHTRLTAADLAGIEVRRNENSEGPDTWRVVLVPALHVPIEGVDLAARSTVFVSQEFAAQATAEDVRQRVVEHLQWAAR